MEARNGSVMPGSKTGIIVRLSNLIVLQVLFVFAALALILFVPGSDTDKSVIIDRQGHALYDAGEAVSAYLEAAAPWAPGGSEENPFISLQKRLDSLTPIDQAALIRVNDSSRFDMLYAYTRLSSDGGEDGGERDLSQFIDPVLLRHVSNLTSSDPAHPTIGPRFLVYYKKLGGSADVKPLVLVVGAEHGLAISSRSGLEYAVFVLFLCAALVSLLTVSLLLRKFKRPLDQIISGLGETADGKLHHLLDLEKDPELGRLARAYNEMTRRLWDDRLQLDSYVGRLAGANAELSESQSFLSTLVACSPLSVVVASRDGRIMLFNRAATKEFGYEPEEIVGRPLSALVAEGAGCSAAETDDSQNHDFEVICRRKDGVLFPAYVVSSDVKAQDDRVLARVYVCRDITESRSFQEMIIRLDRYYTKGEMAGDIAHEINNYLAVLMGNVELMPLLLKKGDSEKINKKLDVMKTTLEKIARFSDGLLDSSPDMVRLEPTSINQVVENVIAFLRPQNKFDSVEVVKELSNEIPVMHVDAGQIQQLLVNLIYNAAEALVDKQGDRTIWVTTCVSEVGKKKAVRISVRDNGPGVVADKVPLLFNTRFTTKPRGHGIGLITCRKIVENHNGIIDYRLQDGAVFSLELPVNAEVEMPVATQLESSVAKL